jgi:HlyD family secretion protein
MKRWMKRLIPIVIVVVGLGLAGSGILKRGNDGSQQFRTASVKRGDLVTTISATGTVQPEEVVDVGAQVAGKIVEFGQDQSGKAIDYGSSVEEGTVLAQIDDALYASDVDQAQAQLEQAQAGVTRAQADQVQMEARLVQAERDWARARKLGASEALARTEYDAALSAYEVAKANVAVGKASVSQAVKSVAQAEAGLRRAQQNLNYCIIKSPVKGVIIDRRVNIGQTVVASLNAPSLFLIAKDLKRLQVWVAVNEADIGSIYPGQPVTFSVDAFPGEEFKGEVGKVRLNAAMTQNVVTYTVEVLTDNSNGKLLPYLTANVRFLVSEHQDVLLVPNTALRWNPLPDRVAPESRTAAESGTGGAPIRRTAGAAQPGSPGYTQGVVWVPHGDHVRSIAVEVGSSDGSSTEIRSKDIQEGVLVITGEDRKEAAAPAQASPFAPQLRGSGRQQSR